MSAQECKPVLLMVSGGSDSMALLEMAAADCLPEQPCDAHFKVLHINHMLRGAQSDSDEQLVETRCAELGIPFEARCIDVAALVASSSAGMEAVAREQRYAAAEEALDAWCAQLGVEADAGRIYTAHTLDDRIETFLMRALVGTGPGGLASIPKTRGRIYRPLLSWGREDLRQWLREQHQGASDGDIWHDDPTNSDGSNFRSKVRVRVMPALREVHPNFERNLERTMDLIAEEDDALSQQACSLAYRNVAWDGVEALVPIASFKELSTPAARRYLRQCLLVVNPDSRLESQQIDRILNGMIQAGFSTEVDGGVRVVRDGDQLRMFVAQ